MTQRGYCVKMSATGPVEDVATFVVALKKIDNDFPYELGIDGYETPGYLVPDTTKTCNRCGGQKWNLPSILPRRIKMLATQCNAKIKIRQWAKISTCWVGDLAKAKEKQNENRRIRRVWAGKANAAGASASPDATEYVAC